MLTPMQGALLERLHRGCTDAELMASFHIKRSTLYMYLWQLKKALGVTILPGRRNKWVRHPEDDETPDSADARVARDLAAGKRCQRCHLLLPCDHG